MFLYFRLKRLAKKVINNKKRYKHSLSTAKLAYKLAKKHGVNPKKAYIAGLFHDFSKFFTKDQYLSFLSYDEFNQNKDYIQLHHGPSAAYYFKYFILDDNDCFNSIYFHTVANLEMSNLSKIIFISDKAEKNRKYQEVEPIRKEMFFDLDYAFLLTLEADILYLKSNKIKPVQLQLLAYNYYKEKVWKKLE